MTGETSYKVYTKQSQSTFHFIKSNDAFSVFQN